MPAIVCGDINNVSYSDPTDTGFEGMLDLGRLLPTGLSGTEVQSFLTLAQYKSINIDTYVEFDLLIVPEPSARVLLMLAAGITGFRVRRAARGRFGRAAPIAHVLRVRSSSSHG